jgi:GT2 family glycosyltransferase
LLPEDRDDLPEVVPVEWLNATCVVYRREALPDPVFSPFFQGYSFMEDVALSLTVARGGWKLANARTARIFHDSQTGDHKKSFYALARMSLVNRHHVMTRVLGRRGWRDHAKLALLESFGLATALASARGRRRFFPELAGKLSGVWAILRGKTGELAMEPKR